MTAYAVAADTNLLYANSVPDFIAEIQLTSGTVRIRLLGKEAPIHVLNFKKLAENGFYDGLTIHRVVPNLVIQGGDPRGDGWGGAGEVIHDQMNPLTYKRGMVGMTRWQAKTRADHNSSSPCRASRISTATIQSLEK